MSNVLTCVYCGHQYPDGTPAAKHEALTEHIQTCEAHPLAAMTRRHARLREALFRIAGVPQAASRDEQHAYLDAVKVELEKFSADPNACDALFATITLLADMDEDAKGGASNG